MPFASQKQKGYLFSKKPEVAQKFAADSKKPRGRLEAMFGKKKG